MKQFNLLAIDTSMEACSASVLVDGKQYSAYEECPQQHSQKILPMIDRLLNECGSEIADMDYLVFGRGPGSFTGVRIACGIVQGLAFGANKRVIGISTLAAMAQTSAEQRISVASDARMGEVYYGEYERSEQGNLTCLSERVISPSLALESMKIFNPAGLSGSGWQAYPEFAELVEAHKTSTAYPHAEKMIELALNDLQNTTNKRVGIEASELEPVYLRDKVTWKKLPGKE